LSIIAQDPSVKRADGKILVTQVEVPNECLRPGPHGYRLRVIDCDATSGVLYAPAELPQEDTLFADSVRSDVGAADFNARLLEDPAFHAQNVYAVIMATLARFELALGRRVSWSMNGHQLKAAPHAFEGANAFYSEEDEGLFFGYFHTKSEPVFTCLSRDVVAHETTHAILDGLRTRYTEPSSPDQAAFHEGFADIVAILSVFSSVDLVMDLLPRGKEADTVPRSQLTTARLKKSTLLGLAEEMGVLSHARGAALRQSAQLPPGDYLGRPDFQEPHQRGEVLVAAVLNTFLDMWVERVERLGTFNGQVDRGRVAEDGVEAASHLLTMAIRAIDYAPPVDLQFGDYLSALITADRELYPDDSLHCYRDKVRASFAEYGILPTADTPRGAWAPFNRPVSLRQNHFESLQSNADEVFRFVWENREALELYPGAYCRVHSVRPCVRHAQDGFFLKETVAEYTEILTLEARELGKVKVIANGKRGPSHIEAPEGLAPDALVRLFGGGTLIFDEFGQLKFHIKNWVNSPAQTRRLEWLAQSGHFDLGPKDHENRLAQLHLQRASGV
jgi:hypothetical protein